MTDTLPAGMTATNREPMPCDDLPFIERLRHAAAWQARDPNFSTCFRCHMPWSAVTEKCVYLPGYSDGGFAICQSCWDELGTTEARIPFYLLLPPWWASRDSSYADEVEAGMERMRRAVIYTSEQEQ